MSSNSKRSSSGKCLPLSYHDLRDLTCNSSHMVCVMLDYHRPNPLFSAPIVQNPKVLTQHRHFAMYDANKLHSIFSILELAKEIGLCKIRDSSMETDY